MKRRRGFTLVELMVAMALIIFIMAILSQAFVAATSVFHELKSAGDMAEKLRATTQILQRDLSADHFEGKKRLSNVNFWDNGPPQQGFFRVWHGSVPIAPTAAIPYPPSAIEGADLDGIISYRSVDHMLAFSVKLRGDQMGDFLTASGPLAGGPLTGVSTFGPNEARYETGTTYNYQWAEVAWFLQPSVNPATGVQDMTAADPSTGAQPLPLYTLYRVQRLAVPDNGLVHQPSNPTANPPYIDPFAYTSQVQYNGLYSTCLELSCWGNPTSNILIPGTNVPGSLYFNNPMDLTAPSRRFGMVPYNSSNAATQAGLLYGVPVPLFPLPIWPLMSPPAPSGTWVPPTNPAQFAQPLYYPYAPPGGPLLAPYYPTMYQQGATGALVGADIQLTDVVSFDVRLLVTDKAGTPIAVPGSVDPFVTMLSYNPSINPPLNNNVFAAFMNSAVPYPLNPAFFAHNPAPTAGGPTLLGPAVFDTWSSINDGLSNYSTWNTASTAATANYAAAPLWNGTSGPIIKAIQITIRIWDQKTSRSRQVTIVQAM